MNKTFKKATSLLLLAGLTTTFAVGCGNNNNQQQAPADNGQQTDQPAALDKITVGASPSPHAEILAAAKDALAEKGYELEIVEFTDYVQPNTNLEDGSIDANYFQHLPYLESFNVDNDTHIVSAGAIHYEPMGIFPGKTASLEELADGAIVAVPNDTTNEARALLLLEANGLITVDPEAGLNATKYDIIDNPKNLVIEEMEAAQITSILPDVDLAVINGNYAIPAGLNVASDSLALEDKDSEAAQTYGNIVAVREGEEGSDKTKALVEALQSDAVKTFINEKYEGAVVPIF